MIARNTISVLSLTFLLFVAASISTNVSAAALTPSLPGGPFVDDLVHKVIVGGDQQILALINDDVDLIGEMIDPAYLPALESAEDIELAHFLRNGYGYLAIKTDKYPLNITDFRRAFAFALDKERICNETWSGLAVPQDSPVPQQNPFSIEGQLPYTYYEADVELGNRMLDAAGFLDVDSDGFREAPDGSDFDIRIDVASSSPVAIQVGEIAAEALQGLDIDAVSEPTDFYEYLTRLYFHADFDMAFLGESFSDFDVSWLAYEYWSEYADEAYHNYPCWRNATYSSWREQLLHSADYEEVLEAALKMQEIWIHACPEVICYQNSFSAAYRTARFEGFVNSVVDGVPGWWTNYKVHLKESEGGPLGGEFRWSTPLDIDSLNFMVVASGYCPDILTDYLYDSLIAIDADGHDIPWLAESCAIRLHDDNPAIPEGHTELTFNIVQNATWTDGTPLTGEDVAFTLNYYRDAPGNPYGVDLSDMTAAYAPELYTVVVEFSAESFWHLHTIGYKPIIPKHIFEAIGVNNWNTWNPTPDDLVTSGPFVLSEYVPGEYCRLSYNPGYFRGADRAAPVLGHPADIAYVQGSTGNIIVWPALDSRPASYTVYKNSTVYGAGQWAGGNISVQVDGFGPGVYNFTLCVFDTILKSASDTVWVTVNATTGSTTTSITSAVWPFGPLSPLSLGVTAGSLVVMLLVGGYTVISRRRGA